MKGQVLNIAHRGARSLAPENTLEAARKALEAGADMWEVDVCFTKDGRLVIMHDDTLTRTTDAVRVYPQRTPWDVSQFSYQELEHLDAGSWFADTDPFGEIAAGHVSKAELRSYRGAHIPTLEEVLVFTRDHDWRVNLELKVQHELGTDVPIVPRVLESIDETHTEEHVLISSFHHAWLRQVQQEAPYLPVAALIEEGGEGIDWQTLEFPMYNLHVPLATKERIKQLKEAGRAVTVWVVNDPEQMRHFIALGVDGMFTDFPQRLTHVLAELDP